MKRVCRWIPLAGCLLVAQAWGAAPPAAPMDVSAAQPASSASMTLTDLIGRAVADHPTISGARAGVSAAKQDSEAADLQRYPALSIQSDAGSSGKPSSALVVSQPLWTGGRLTGQIAQADESLKAARARVNEVRYDQALKVIAGWQALAIASQHEEVYARTLDRLSELAAMMQRRVKADVSPRIELDLLQARVQQAQADLLQSQSEQRVARNRLAQLVGGALPARIEALTELPDNSSALGASLLGSLPAELVDRMLQTHPSVVRLTYEAASAREAAKVRSADQWPQLYARWQRAFPDNSASTGVSPSRLSLSLQYTPGAGLASGAQAKGAEARAEGALFAVDAMRRDLSEQLSADWMEMQNQRKRMDGLQQGIGFNRSVLESYERQFIAGKRTWLDVLNALRETQTSELSLIDARLAAVAAHERMKVRLGAVPGLRDTE